MGVFDVVKAYTPWAIRRASHRVKREVRWARNARQPVGKVFEDVYNQGMWGGEQGKFYSGPGSEGDAARIYAQGIRGFITERNISSVVDLGCGDFRVASQFLDDQMTYVGVDIVGSLVRENGARYRQRQGLLCMPRHYQGSIAGRRTLPHPRGISASVQCRDTRGHAEASAIPVRGLHGSPTGTGSSMHTESRYLSWRGYAHMAGLSPVPRSAAFQCACATVI